MTSDSLIDSMQGCPEPMDKGPWHKYDHEGRYIASTDNTHDALLKIDGDFESNEERAEYAKWLASELNRAAQTRHLLLMVRNRLASNNQAMEDLFKLFEVTQ